MLISKSLPFVSHLRLPSLYQPCGTTNLLCTSMDFLEHNLALLNKWIHITYEFYVGFLSLSILSELISEDKVKLNCLKAKCKKRKEKYKYVLQLWLVIKEVKGVLHAQIEYILRNYKYSLQLQYMILFKSVSCFSCFLIFMISHSLWERHSEQCLKEWEQ